PIPLWAVITLAGAVALAFYLSLSWSLSGRSDAVFQQIAGLSTPTIDIQRSVEAAPAVAPRVRLAQFLAAEINENLLTVRDEADRSVIVLRGDGLFESGADRVQGQYLPVLSRVADALNATQGALLVTGHSDNVPIKTVRFPSNWELSQARADAVKTILDQRLHDKTRVRAEGKGEAEPIAPNDTAANRARNRRVEIMLLVAPVSGEPS